jgi:hypothetical protein
VSPSFFRFSVADIGILLPSIVNPLPRPWQLVKQRLPSFRHGGSF